MVRAGVHVAVRHGEVGFTHPHRHGPPGPVIGFRTGWIRIELVQMNPAGQHPHGRCFDGVARGHLLHGRGHRRHQRLGAVYTVQARHADHQMEPLAGHRTARPVQRDLAGDAVDLGLVDIAQPELDLGAQVVADPRLELRPPRGGDHRVHAVGQPLPCDVLHDGFQLGELRGERRPPVDHQEHVAEWIRRRRVLRVFAHLPVVGHRSDPELFEGLLTLPQNSFDLCDDAVDPIGLGAGGDTTHLGQVLDVHEATAAHVHAVELDLPRGVRCRRREDERLQECRLAGLRGAADGDVARCGGDVDTPDFLAVPAGFVHHTQTDSQWATVVVTRDQFVDRSGIGQRGQPHPVRMVLTGGQLVEDDLTEHLLPGFDRHCATVASMIGAAVNRWIRSVLSAWARGASSSPAAATTGTYGLPV